MASPHTGVLTALFFGFAFELMTFCVAMHSHVSKPQGGKPRLALGQPPVALTCSRHVAGFLWGPETRGGAHGCTAFPLFWPKHTLFFALFFW